MSTMVVADRVTVADLATAELDLLNEDPSGYAGKLGLPVDLCELTDTELITADDGLTSIFICIAIA